MYSNLFSPDSIAELTVAMQTQFPKAIWETFYVTLLSTALAVVIGLVLVGRFVRRQLKLPVPMLKVDILKTRKYATTVVIIVIVQAALMGTGVITPLYIQGVCGYSATM